MEEMFIIRPQSNFGIWRLLATASRMTKTDRLLARLGFGRTIMLSARGRTSGARPRTPPLLHGRGGIGGATPPPPIDAAAAVAATSSRPSGTSGQRTPIQRRSRTESG